MSNFSALTHDFMTILSKAPIAGKTAFHQSSNEIEIWYAFATLRLALAGVRGIRVGTGPLQVVDVPDQIRTLCMRMLPLTVLSWITINDT
jgi:hypothetical protein